MELAAVVVIPSSEDLTSIGEAQPHTPAASEESQALYSSRKPILGNDVLRSWMEPVRKLGLRTLWLASRPLLGENLAHELGRFTRQGVERLLMIKLKSYAEIDLTDLLRFHCERRNSVTEAKDTHGQLGVSLIDHPSLRSATHVNEFNGHAPYRFRGYAKRILSAKERQELVGDALIGACAMKPSGTQIREQVWIGEGVKLEESVRVIGPTYIGTRTLVRAGVTIGPFASLERDCVVDCGTAVEQSTVLPHTYLAPGLLIRRALVDGERLEDLRSGVVADLQPARLGSRLHRRSTFGEPLADLFSRQGSTSPWGFATELERAAAVAPGAVVKSDTATILAFAGGSSSAGRRAQRKDLLRALRFSGAPVIIDLSACVTLNHEDIGLLLECLAHVAGRDTKIFLAAASPVNRVLLEATRISLVVPVLSSVEEALAHPTLFAENGPEDSLAARSQTRSA